MTENNYQESACEAVLELMRECCRKYQGRSICCEGIDIGFSKAVVESKTPKKLDFISMKLSVRICLFSLEFLIYYIFISRLN